MASRIRPAPDLGYPLLSRRRCLPLLAAAALSPLVLTSARAQDVWQIYRREDLGFEVEMPGKPEIDVEEAEDKDDIWIKTIDAEVTFEDTLFGANYQEFKRSSSIEEEAAAQREGAQHIGSKITRETDFKMGDFAGREFVAESETLNGIVRMVIVKNMRIMVSAFGDQSIHKSPAVRRFLDSLKLLPR